MVQSLPRLLRRMPSIGLFAYPHDCSLPLLKITDPRLSGNLLIRPNRPELAPRWG